MSDGEVLPDADVPDTDRALEDADAPEELNNSERPDDDTEDHGPEEEGRGAGAELEPNGHVEPPAPPVADVTDLDWEAISRAAAPDAVRARMPGIVAHLERLLDDGSLRMMFDEHRATPDDRAIAVRDLPSSPAPWFIGDLHGDLLALESALALASDAPLIFLGDLFDDGGYGLEVLVRVFELIVARPESVCLVAGNHDEALAFDGERFTASVSPSDFSDFLNEQLGDEWIRRAGALAVRLFARAPRALFLPDGLLVVHGGIPLTDLHDVLRATGNWNDAQCLVDFAWTRAHSRARRKIPNRVSRGSQFGYEDFAAFCALSQDLGRPLRRMVRGHDHEEERYAMPAAWAAHPLLTTVALSRRLPREVFGPHVRVPTIARYVADTLPQVHRLHIPEEMVRAHFPEDDAVDHESAVPPLEEPE